MPSFGVGITLTTNPADPFEAQVGDDLDAGRGYKRLTIRVNGSGLFFVGPAEHLRAIANAIMQDEFVELSLDRRGE